MRESAVSRKGAGIKLLKTLEGDKYVKIATLRIDHCFYWIFGGLFPHPA
jgi:hypothetical protein